MAELKSDCCVRILYNTDIDLFFPAFATASYMRYFYIKNMMSQFCSCIAEFVC